MALIEREMPVNRVAEMLGVLPQRIWTVFNHWVANARQSDDPSTVHRLGIDETSTKKGHNYVTLGVDLDTSRVIHVVEGKGKETLAGIQQYLECKGVQKRRVTQLSMDLSPAVIAGAADSSPLAEITFDRFHVVKLLNEAMDKVRKAEGKEHDDLKGLKYVFMVFAKTVKAHWTGIVNFVETRITNGVMEGINSKIQLAKRRARGYRNINNFISMIYFTCGKMTFSYPRYST